MGQQLFKSHLEIFDSVKSDDSTLKSYLKRFEDDGDDINFFFTPKSLTETDDYHPILTFYFINKYGIYSDYQWLQNLSNLNQIKSICYSLISKKYHQDLSIILDSLQLISNIDNKPLFYW